MAPTILAADMLKVSLWGIGVSFAVLVLFLCLLCFKPIGKALLGDRSSTSAYAVNSVVTVAIIFAAMTAVVLFYRWGW